MLNNNSSLPPCKTDDVRQKYFMRAYVCDCMRQFVYHIHILCEYLNMYGFARIQINFKVILLLLVVLMIYWP